MSDQMSAGRRRPPRLVATATAIVATGVAGAGLAWASIPDQSGVIHACTKDTGDVRIVDPTVTKCKTNETALQWNETGPQGPQGAPGPKGDPGPTGPAGPGGGTGLWGSVSVSSGLLTRQGPDVLSAWSDPASGEVTVVVDRDLGSCVPVVSARGGMIADFGWDKTSLIVDLLADGKQQTVGDFTFAIFCR
jgi:hypothetical protein